MNRPHKGKRSFGYRVYSLCSYHNLISFHQVIQECTAIPSHQNGRGPSILVQRALHLGSESNLPIPPVLQSISFSCITNIFLFSFLLAFKPTLFILLTKTVIHRPMSSSNYRLPHSSWVFSPLVTCPHFLLSLPHVQFTACLIHLQRNAHPDHQ